MGDLDASVPGNIHKRGSWSSGFEESFWKPTRKAKNNVDAHSETFWGEIAEHFTQLNADEDGIQDISVEIGTALMFLQSVGYSGRALTATRKAVRCGNAKNQWITQKVKPSCTNGNKKRTKEANVR